MPGLTAELGCLIAAASAAPIGGDVIAAAKRAFIDTIGVMIAGRREHAVAIAERRCPDGNEAAVPFSRQRLSAKDAALLSGVAGHVLDYDDVTLHGHASVVLVPAILAEAQRLGSSGAAALRAYAIGFEVWIELGRREQDAYHLGSWHPTTMLGVVAATAAVAALNRLNEAEARNALAVAASFASGVIANFGTDTKPLQVGRAAANAIEAVALAKAGLTGAPDALEAPHGLLRGLSPHGRVDTQSALRCAGSPWRLLEQGVSVKRYPVCYAAHRAIDGVLALSREAGLQAAGVRSVRVMLGPAQAATLRYHRPSTGLEARFSLQHNIAAALLDGQVGFAQLSDAYVGRAELIGLYDRISCEIAGEECSEQPGMARFDRVVIETVDGRYLDSGGIRYARGHAGAPLSDGELDAKFLDCARHGGVSGAALLLDRLRHLDEMADIGDLLPRPEPPGADRAREASHDHRQVLR